MYDHLQNEKDSDCRFNGALHGAEFKDEKKKEEKTTRDSKGNEIFVFQDADSYNHLSAEERKVLTQKMKRSHQAFASNKLGKR